MLTQYYKTQLLPIPDKTRQLATDQLYRTGQFPSRNLSLPLEQQEQVSFPAEIVQGYIQNTSDSQGYYL